MDTKELKLSAILSIDIPGLSFSGESDDEAGSIELCHRLIENSALSHNGNLIKAIGDSFIIAFANCQDAVACALHISGRLAMPRDASSPTLKPRMGIHLGDVHFFEKNVFGDAVDIASALQAAAKPGSVCVSGEVLSLVRDKMGLNAALLSEARHKALPAGIMAYELSIAAARAAEAEPLMPSGPSLEEIRKAILEEIRVQGRRLTVDEARRKFGWYGVEATEVIATLAEAGILIGKNASSSARPRMETSEGETSWSEPPRSGAPGYSSANAAGDLGKSIESAIHSIVSEIERAVETGSRGSGTGYGSGSPGSGIHIKLDKESFKDSARDLKEVGREIKRQVKESMRSEYRGADHAERHSERRAEREARRANRRGYETDDSSLSTASFRKYRASLAKKAGNLGKGLVGGIISFIVVNAGLWFVNLNYAKEFPWAAIVSIFWGFGIVDSILASIRVYRQSREAEALPDLDDTQTKELKAIHGGRDSLGKHFISTLSIPSALAFINMTTEPANPWFIIPAAVLAATFVIHLITYVFTAPGRSRRFFEKLGIGRGRKGMEEAKKRKTETTTELGAYASIYRDAQDCARDIASSLSSSDPSTASEMKPQLEGYLNQVLLLAKTANELDSIVAEIPMEALQKDKATLMSKLGNSKEGMKLEYESSIKEIEKQEESFKALAEQREVIDLRLRTSVNQLQQLKMDLARVKAADTEIDSGSAESALSSIRARSEELSRYIDDLKEGNLEALADPFLELEKKYGDAALPPEKEKQS